MKQSKIITIVIGFILLISLSLTIFFLDRDTPSTNIPESNVVISEEETDENGQSSSINIEGSEQDSDIPDEEEISDIDERELHRHARVAISSAEMNESAPEMNEQTLFDHALLYQSYTLLLDDHILDEEFIKRDSEWMAIELMGWHDYASEQYQFSYSFHEFIQFIENNNYLFEEDINTTILFDELKSISDDLYHRQLEIHYLKPFIWENIQEEVAKKYDFDSEDAELNYNLLFAFEEEVMNTLFEQNPDFFEE